MENYGKNLSPTFNKNQDLVAWIGEQQYNEMLVRHLSNNSDICGYVGKLPEQHFDVWLFSNPGDKIHILVKNNEARTSDTPVDPEKGTKTEK